ncbi:MAG: JAB domain-containing protein [Flavobacterium sp.]
MLCRKITRKIKEVGIMLKIEIIDHLIISLENYYSFADSGKL